MQSLRFVFFIFFYTLGHPKDSIRAAFWSLVILPPLLGTIDFSFFFFFLLSSSMQRTSCSVFTCFTRSFFFSFSPRVTASEVTTGRDRWFSTTYTSAVHSFFALQSCSLYSKTYHQFDNWCFLIRIRSRSREIQIFKPAKNSKKKSWILRFRISLIIKLLIY